MKEIKICIGNEDVAFELDGAEITVTVDPATWMRRQDHNKEMVRLQAFADRQSERLQAALETNESYAEKIQSLRKELSAAKNVVQQLEDKNERLVLDAYTARSEAGGRKEECLRLQRKLKETEELWHNSNDHLADSRLTATGLGQKLCDARREINRLNIINDMHTNKLEAVMDSNRTLQNVYAENSTLMIEKNALEKALKDEQVEVERLSILDADRIAKIDELANCLQAERHEVERLKALLEARQDSTPKYENAALKELCDERSREIGRLSRELSEKNTKLLQLKERLAQIAEDI